MGAVNQPTRYRESPNRQEHLRSSGKPVRVLIADDHELIRHGLRELLRLDPGCQICGEAHDGLEAVEMAKQLRPDIVLLDISMPSLNGLEATRQICKVVPGVEVLILTVHDSEQLVRDVLAAGARGYLTKSDAARDLLAAVDSLRLHRPFFTSKVGRMVLEGFLAKTASAQESADTLSDRERQIVQLLAEGKSNKEVAALLGISVKTAETHRNRIMRKLKLDSICDLVHYAVRNEIVEA
jgi:DNA-binding NarL/FixJ family response regulator